ncbi:MAG: hypothetical protein HY235_01045 [Acidobacteria bacterium]|nr:hypothetical protein [Acidobacteriota bacterium]
MPNATRNKMVLKIKAGPCLDTNPKTIRWLRKNGADIVLEADAANHGTVTIKLGPDARNLFENVGNITINLGPGQSKTLKLLEDLGLTERKNNFVDIDPVFAHVYSFFDHQPDACGPGDHNDIHVEC